jgi:hypothetical protein
LCKSQPQRCLKFNLENKFKRQTAAEEKFYILEKKVVSEGKAGIKITNAWRIRFVYCGIMYLMRKLSETSKVQVNRYGVFF